MRGPRCPHWTSAPKASVLCGAGWHTDPGRPAHSARRTGRGLPAYRPAVTPAARMGVQRLGGALRGESVARGPREAPPFCSRSPGPAQKGRVFGVWNRRSFLQRGPHTISPSSLHWKQCPGFAMVMRGLALPPGASCAVPPPRRAPLGRGPLEGDRRVGPGHSSSSAERDERGWLIGRVLGGSGGSLRAPQGPGGPQTGCDTSPARLGEGPLPWDPQALSPSLLQAGS